MYAARRWRFRARFCGEAAGAYGCAPVFVQTHVPSAKPPSVHWSRTSAVSCLHQGTAARCWRCGVRVYTGGGVRVKRARAPVFLPMRGGVGVACGVGAGGAGVGWASCHGAEGGRLFHQPEYASAGFSPNGPRLATITQRGAAQVGVQNAGTQARVGPFVSNRLLLRMVVEFNASMALLGGGGKKCVNGVANAQSHYANP